MVIMVMWLAGWAVVCLIHSRAYTTGAMVETLAVVAAKTWLQ
nr:hypothetical protein [Acrocarpospora pleiomorpha]